MSMAGQNYFNYYNKTMVEWLLCCTHGVVLTGVSLSFCFFFFAVVVYCFV